MVSDLFYNSIFNLSTVFRPKEVTVRVLTTGVCLPLTKLS